MIVCKEDVQRRLKPSITVSVPPKMTEITPDQRDAPIFKTFGELFAAGFSLDTTTWVFILTVHIAAVGFGWVANFYRTERMGLDCGWLDRRALYPRFFIHHGLQSSLDQSHGGKKCVDPRASVFLFFRTSSKRARQRSPLVSQSCVASWC